MRGRYDTGDYYTYYDDVRLMIVSTNRKFGGVKGVPI